MSSLLELLTTRTWWSYDPQAPGYAQPYHAFNLFEGFAWWVLAALVLIRYLRHRNSPLELAYGAAFVTFGLSDFVEAYRVTSWLILSKGVNLVALLYLRQLVIRRFYPESKTY